MRVTDQELIAWQWILDLPRNGSHRQIRIEIEPGNYGEDRGAPLIVLTLTHPDAPGEDWQVTANNLYEAVERVSQQMSFEGGIHTPSLTRYLLTDRSG